MTLLLRRVLGETLRGRRLRQQRTLREVSGSARVSLGYLSEVERGQKEASSELLAAICTALDLKLSDLLREVSETMRRAEVPDVARVPTRPLVPAGRRVPVTSGAPAPRPAPLDTLDGLNLDDVDLGDVDLPDVPVDSGSASKADPPVLSDRAPDGVDAELTADTTDDLTADLTGDLTELDGLELAELETDDSLDAIGVAGLGEVETFLDLAGHAAAA